MRRIFRGKLIIPNGLGFAKGPIIKLANMHLICEYSKLLFFLCKKVEKQYLQNFFMLIEILIILMFYNNFFIYYYVLLCRKMDTCYHINQTLFSTIAIFPTASFIFRVCLNQNQYFNFEIKCFHLWYYFYLFLFIFLF